MNPHYPPESQPAMFNDFRVEVKSIGGFTVHGDTPLAKSLLGAWRRHVVKIAGSGGSGDSSTPDYVEFAFTSNGEAPEKADRWDTPGEAARYRERAARDEAERAAKAGEDAARPPAERLRGEMNRIATWLENRRDPERAAEMLREAAD